MKIDIKRESFLLILLAMFLISLPITYGLNSVSTILIGVFFFVDTKTNIKKKICFLSKNTVFIFFLAIFLTQLFGCFYSENTKQSFKVIQSFLPFIVLPITLLSEKVEISKIKKTLLFFVYYFCIVNIGLLVYEYVINNSILKFEQNTFQSLDISTFYYSAFTYVSVLVLLIDLEVNLYKRYINYLLISFLFFILLLLSARISILILFLMCLAFTKRSFIKHKENKKIKFFVIIVVIISSLYVVTKVPQLKTKIDITTRTFDYEFKKILTKNQISLSRNSLEYRVLINYCSWLIVTENLLGVGTGDNREALMQKYKDINFRAGVKSNFNAHNQYMEEATKTGLLGSIILLAFIFYLLKISFQKKSYLFYVVFYVSMVCLTESFLYRHHGIMFTAFFISLFYNLEFKQTNK